MVSGCELPCWGCKLDFIDACDELLDDRLLDVLNTNFYFLKKSNFISDAKAIKNLAHGSQYLCIQLILHKKLNMFTSPCVFLLLVEHNFMDYGYQNFYILNNISVVVRSRAASSPCQRLNIGSKTSKREFLEKEKVFCCILFYEN